MRAHGIEDLLRAALPALGRTWKILLGFHPTEDEEADFCCISRSIPWVWRVERASPGVSIVEDLRRHRFSVIVCDSEEEAKSLLQWVQGHRITARLYGPDGSAGASSLW